MNILRRIRWDYILVTLLMFAGCVAFWYFVILWFVKLIKMAMGLTS